MHCRRDHGSTHERNPLLTFTPNFRRYARSTADYELIALVWSEYEGTPANAGDVAGAEKINRPCLVLLPGLFASMGDDVYRRSMAIVWAACSAWTGRIRRRTPINPRC